MADKLRIAKVANVQVLAGGDISVVTLHLTAHHLILSQAIPSPPTDPKSSDKHPPRPRTRESWIAYPMISLCTFRPSPPSSGVPSSIRLRGRDFKFLTFNIEDDKQARDVFESIRGATCKLKSVDKLYAFVYEAPPQEKKINGWEVYDAKAEWRRQGISEKGVDKGWRISKINVDYAFSPTYPALLPVPSTISDNTLNYAGRYRSRVRIPVLTYLHPVNNCSITRCSQPLAGIRGARSIQDEKLVSACFSATPQIDGLDNTSSTTLPRVSPASSSTDLADSNIPADGEISETERLEDQMISSTSTMEVVSEKTPHIYGAQQHNLIVDARPTVNALAMQAIGLGTENMDHYKFATKVYLGIDNIHVMRESLNKVIDTIKDSDLSRLPINREQLAKSNWIKHITGLLDGSALIARQVAIQHSHVLIHCSDGWDRTSQLSAISQLLLDPYYRTIEGFIVLIEKDWLAFGHMFQHRTGYLNHEKWFQTQNDALAGTAIQPGGADGLENALLSAKRFFNKNSSSTTTDGVDSDGEMLPGDELSKAKLAVKEGKDKEATKPKETSPVFHQFLDATYQIIYQHPTRFEFNERFLRRLLYHQYSCQYGTFLYNNEKARLDAKLKERTESVWGYFLSRKQEFTNPNWDGGVIDDHVKGSERLVFPNLSKVRWWNEVFNRSDLDMNGPANTVVEKYLGDGSSKDVKKDGLGSVGVITGVETAHVAQAVGTSKGVQSPKSTSNGTANNGAASTVTAGLANLKEGFAGLNLGLGGNKSSTSRSKSPAATEKQALEVEMQ